MSVKHMDITLPLGILVRALFPEAQIETDNDSQIIIYTGEYQEVSE